MTIKQLLRFYGNNISLCARELDVTRRTVYQWETKGEVPYRYQCVAEVVSKGELKAERRKSK